MRKNLILLLCTGMVVFLGLAYYVRVTRTQNLPYIDSFARGSVKEWRPFGGSWRIDGDAMVVIASEMGAKLTTGSQRWTDYDMSADVELLGHEGNFGIVVRVGDTSVGSEAIRGYLINLRSSDAGIEITRASKTFLSLAPVHLTGGVNTNTWYRIHVIASGCRIAAEATNLATGQSAYIGFEDSPSMCIRSGGIALRTTATATAWKHIQVRKAEAGEIEKMWAQVPGGSTASYPIREREYTAMREDYLAKVPPSEIHRPTILGSFGPIGELDKVEVVQIDDLATRLWDTKDIRIVGVVTATSPLYVQDATAGILLATAAGEAFHRGDEIEILGRPERRGSILRFQAIAGRFLSDREPVVPLSVTATQAASGRYEGLLIEVNGVVRSNRKLSDGALEVMLEDGTQRFTVRVPYDLFSASAPQLEENSRLRVRGVCSMEDSAGLRNGTFVLYARSSADVTLLGGPPWWSGERLIWLICICFLTVGAGIVLYGVEERTKFRIVQEERERLSHDMHDTLAQTLAGVGFRLQGILRSLQASPSVPKVHVDDLKNTCELVAHSHREASSNIAALHPASQRESDVLALLEKAIYSMLDDEDFPVIVSSHGTPRTMSPVVADTLFRVGREAVANALRHSKARSIKVQLHYRSRDVTLSVTDDGVGFQFDPSRAGFGIRSMIRRCEAIRANIRFTSPEGGGCRVQVISRYRVYRGLIRWVG